jgi:hypothetical protein
MEVQLGIAGILVIVAGFVGLLVLARAIARASARQRARVGREMNERMETLFQTGFPELQPHFHPKNVYEYAKGRQARKASSGPLKWRNPPGFSLATYAEIELDGLKDKVRLLDAKEAVLASFVFEEHPEGAVIRLGKGKFTVGLKGAEPRVRYWHPEREFKWTPTMWNIKTGVSDQALQSSSSDHDSSSGSDSSSSSSSTSRTATAAAAGAGIVAAGGTFDGGGASAAWDDGGGGSPGSSSDSSPDFSSVDSGSSSTSSTTY